MISSDLKIAALKRSSVCELTKAGLIFSLCTVHTVVVIAILFVPGRSIQSQCTDDNFI